MTYLLLLIGLVALVVGAELLVTGASGLALRTGLSTVVVGLTVVALGTGAPEFAVAVRSASTGDSALSVGNAVGSNIANVLLVLGLAASLAAVGLAVTERLVRTDVPVMVGVSLLVMALALDRSISRVEGVLFLAGLVGYITWTVRSATKPQTVLTEDYDEVLEPERDDPLWASGLRVLGGLVLLVLGAAWLVQSAGDIARQFGVSELVVGLTVVAIGTTAPEIATSALAALRGQPDMAVANVVGSNVFNLLGVLGIAAVLTPGGLPISDEVIRLDFPVMVAAAVACLPVFFNGFRITRKEGFLFVGMYAAYLTFLVLDSQSSWLRDPFAVVMLVFVLPLVSITLVVIAGREWRARRRR